MADPVAILERESCIRGYHVYQSSWEATIGETLGCRREPTNEIDRYSVAVIKSGAVVGHLPRKISKLCSIFLRRGGSIHCEVIGGRRYSEDLHQGGMEIPCILFFRGKDKEIEKLKKHFKTKHALH